MADVDEDNGLLSSAAPQDQDLSEETQDFRFLSALSSSVILDANQKLPKRGEKDFEANATKHQASTLEASRQAMHDALNHTRIHNHKAHVVATYDPETNGAWVGKAKGTLLNTMGVWRKRAQVQAEASGEVDVEDAPTATGALWLHPEEALFLLERGSLDVHWPAVDGEKLTDGLPMSLQGAHAAFIGMGKPGDLTLEQYSVYASLKRSGYIVVRPSANNATISTDVPPPTTTEANDSNPSSLAAWWHRVTKSEPIHPEHRLTCGPLVTPGLYRSYSMVSC